MCRITNVTSPLYGQGKSSSSIGQEASTDASTWCRQNTSAAGVIEPRVLERRRLAGAWPSAQPTPFSGPLPTHYWPHLVLHPWQKGWTCLFRLCTQSPFSSFRAPLHSPPVHTHKHSSVDSTVQLAHVSTHHKCNGMRRGEASSKTHLTRQARALG